MSTGHILISGCSGGGKSSLLDALHAHGFATVPEPGRRIVEEERARNGSALPWVDMKAFAKRAVEMSRSDLAQVAEQACPVFFDRGLVDAAVALQHAGGEPYGSTLGAERPYENRVLLAPPWPEIFVTDPERRHGFDAAEAEFTRLVRAFEDLGYQTVELPKVPVEERVDFVLQELALTGARTSL